MSPHRRIMNLALRQQHEVCVDVSMTLLKDEAFCTVPSSTGKHHYYKGGNLEHTSEVLEFAMGNAEISSNAKASTGDTDFLDYKIIFLSAILHDYGKIYAYEVDPEKPGHWRKVNGYTIQLHIEKSVEKAKEMLISKVSGGELDHIIHCIGAHHGKIEWGALWLPKTAEAWNIHLSDMLSVFTIANRKS